MKKSRLLLKAGFFGAGNVTRTRDLLITNQLHYRLCYTSIFIFGKADIIISANGRPVKRRIALKF